MMSENGIVTLADGRALSYASYGSPGGRPVIYCHGYPGHHVEFEIIDDVLSQQEVDAHVVALNRPGYGDSDPDPGRNLLDWARDVADAADQLGLGEFAVLGVSGGGPFALACAHQLRERVIRVGVAVGMGPSEATGMEESLLFRTSSRFGPIRRLQYWMLTLGFKRGADDRIAEQSAAPMGEADRAFLEDAPNRDWFLRFMREALKQNGAAAAYEPALYRKSWGFDPGDITTETHLWYGGLDEVVPVAVGEWLHERLPNSTLVLWPEHGHMTWMNTGLAAEVVSVTAGSVAAAS